MKINSKSNISVGVLNKALEEVEKSIYYPFKVGACVFKGDRIISCGHNSKRKSSLIYPKDQRDDTIHAEQDAILGQDWKKLKEQFLMPTYQNTSNHRVSIDARDILPNGIYETMYYLDLTLPELSGLVKFSDVPFYNLTTASDAISGSGNLEVPIHYETQKIEIFNKSQKPVDMYINSIWNTPKLIIHQESICKINEDVHGKIDKLIFVPSVQLNTNDFFVHQFKSFWISFEN